MISISTTVAEVWGAEVIFQHSCAVCVPFDAVFVSGQLMGQQARVCTIHLSLFCVLAFY